MNNGKLFGGGIIGTLLSAVGTATQTNELLQTISLVITILGGFISLILIPLLTWYKKAKEDGKISKEEIDEAIDIAEDGLHHIIKETKEKEDDKNGRNRK